MTTNDFDPHDDSMRPKNSETAANAAVVAHQLVDEADSSKGGSTSKKTSIHRARVVNHPATLLYDLAFAEIVSAVPIIAKHKRIDLHPGEDAAVTQYAMKRLSRKSLKRIVDHDNEAVNEALLAIDHALNIFASNFLKAMAYIAQGHKPPAPEILCVQSEETFSRSANDKRPYIVWPDIETAFWDYVRRNANPPPELKPVDGLRSVKITVRAKLSTAAAPKRKLKRKT